MMLRLCKHGSEMHIRSASLQQHVDVVRRSYARSSIQVEREKGWREHVKKCIAEMRADVKERARQDRERKTQEWNEYRKQLDEYRAKRRLMKLENMARHEQYLKEAHLEKVRRQEAMRLRRLDRERQFHDYLRTNISQLRDDKTERTFIATPEQLRRCVDKLPAVSHPTNIYGFESYAFITPGELDYLRDYITDRLEHPSVELEYDVNDMAQWPQTIPDRFFNNDAARRLWDRHRYYKDLEFLAGSEFASYIHQRDVDQISSYDNLLEFDNPNVEFTPQNKDSLIETKKSSFFARFMPAHTSISAIENLKLDSEIGNHDPFEGMSEESKKALFNIQQMLQEEPAIGETVTSLNKLYGLTSEDVEKMPLEKLFDRIDNTELPEVAQEQFQQVIEANFKAMSGKLNQTTDYAMVLSDPTAKTFIDQLAFSEEDQQQFEALKEKHKQVEYPEEGFFARIIRDPQLADIVFRWEAIMDDPLLSEADRQELSKPIQAEYDAAIAQTPELGEVHRKMLSLTATSITHQLVRMGRMVDFSIEAYGPEFEPARTMPTEHISDLLLEDTDDPSIFTA